MQFDHSVKDKDLIEANKKFIYEYKNLIKN